MTLADARALTPQLTTAETDPDADAAALIRLTDWCRRYSPWSGVDGDDGIRLDITGCAHLFGGEAALLVDGKRRFDAFGVTTCGAIADTPAAAWAWARYRPKNTTAILPKGEIAALMRLPVAALRLPPDTVEALDRLGLRDIGAVAALPRQPLARRMGGQLLDRLDRLFGRADEPISPRPWTEPWLNRLVFAEPVGRREDLDEALTRLMDGLCRALAERGYGARRLEFSLYRVDGSVQRVAVGTSRPMHQPAHLLRLFAERMDSIDPGFGIEATVLEATEAEAVTVHQAGLNALQEGDVPDLAPLVDRLRNRLGRGHVVQSMAMQSHVPERAERWISALSATLPTDSLSHPNRAARALTLLTRPEPIEAMAPVPDDPPLSFRWRRVFHRVAWADGPERIGPEWWKSDPGGVRDYYRVEDSDGRRFWVYREGLYGGAVPPRWFLHGLFP